MISTAAGSLKKGDFISYTDGIWVIVKAEFSFKGRGLANIRLKLKNTISGKNIDVTFKSGDSIETIELETVLMQYLYNDGTNLHFMNNVTYSQYTIPVSQASDFVQFMREGDKYYLLLHNDKALSMRPPTNVRLRVIETENAIKGDRVSAGRKSAKVETGATVMVPLFIKTGETVSINPETGEYVERVKA